LFTDCRQSAAQMQEKIDGRKQQQASRQNRP
jgi:hypothetical protein